MLSRFLLANSPNQKSSFPGGMYIEMQAIESNDWESFLKHDFVLIPWGLVFRIVPQQDGQDLYYYMPQHTYNWCNGTEQMYVTPH